jgi:hypothetical protein
MNIEQLNSSPHIHVLHEQVIASSTFDVDIIGNRSDQHTGMEFDHD